MTSDRIKRALKDYKDILDSGGLAQDDTPEKVFRTMKAMVGRIYAIGLEEGLTNDQIQEKISEVGEVQFRLENQTIYEMIGAITKPSNRPPG